MQTTRWLAVILALTLTHCGARHTTPEVRPARQPDAPISKQPEATAQTDRLRDAFVFDSLLSQAGRVELVSNVAGATCVVDGKPCELAPGQILRLPPGDHVIELSKEGYFAKTQVVVVEANGSHRAVLALEKVPVAPVKPVKAVVTTFGRVQLLTGVDPQNQGDLPDFVAVPDGTLKQEWTTSFQLNGALGGRFKLAKQLGGFSVKGSFLTALYVRRIFTVPLAFISLENEDLGVKIGVGKMLFPTVNSLVPGSFQYPVNFGNLTYSSTGVNASKTMGPILAQVGIGRPEFPLFTSELVPVAGVNPPLPFFEARLAYVNPRMKGTMPASPAGGPMPAPLTVSISAGVGQQRVGPGEKAAVVAAVPGAVDPLNEDLRSWILSAELIVPLGGLVLAAEAVTGKGANVYFAGLRQRPRVDPATGRHTNLGTVGGWVQLSYASTQGWVAMVLGGIDKVQSGLDVGVAVDGSSSISQNRLLLGSISRTLDASLRFGLQLHHLQTKYVGLATGSLIGVTADCSINF